MTIIMSEVSKVISAREEVEVCRERKTWQACRCPAWVEKRKFLPLDGRYNYVNVLEDFLGQEVDIIF